MQSYTADERRELSRAVREEGELRCPACGGAVTRQTVAPGPEVSYVRKRIWLLCGSCRRTAALDLPD